MHGMLHVHGRLVCAPCVQVSSVSNIFNGSIALRNVCCYAKDGVISKLQRPPTASDAWCELAQVLVGLMRVKGLVDKPGVPEAVNRREREDAKDSRVYGGLPCDLQQLFC